MKTEKQQPVSTSSSDPFVFLQRPLIHVVLLVIAIFSAINFLILGHVAEMQDKLYETLNPKPAINTPIETIECPLQFLDMNRQDLVNPENPAQPPPSAYGYGRLCANTEYIVQFNFPDQLLAEVENGANLEVEVYYTFETAPDHPAIFMIDIFSHDSNILYRARNSIYAADQLYIKHSFGCSDDPISTTPEFTNDHFSFSLWTSGRSDAGPKITQVSVNGPYAIDCKLAGRTIHNWQPSWGYDDEYIVGK